MNLTNREVEILKLIANGQSIKEIAVSLDISINTMRNHLSNIYNKTNTTDKTTAVIYAYKNKIIDI